MEIPLNMHNTVAGGNYNAKSLTNITSTTKYKWGFSLAHNIQYITYICIRIGCALLWVYHNS